MTQGAGDQGDRRKKKKEDIVVSVPAAGVQKSEIITVISVQFCCKGTKWHPSFG